MQFENLISDKSNSSYNYKVRQFFSENSKFYFGPKFKVEIELDMSTHGMLTGGGGGERT